jgi:hypothetical protein
MATVSELNLVGRQQFRHRLGLEGEWNAIMRIESKSPPFALHDTVATVANWRNKFE